MLTPPIHTSAAVPVEFIPPVQDVEMFRRVATADISRRQEALDRRISAFNIGRREGRADSEPDNPGFDQEETAIATERVAIAEARETMDRTVAEMTAARPTPQVFLIAVPTSVERDRINARLVSLGLSQVGQEQMRATMIDELFYQDWRPDGYEGEWTAAQNEAAAEDHANFLDGVWQRNEAHDLAITRWQEQERERILDEADGAPPRPRADLPPKIITPRENAKQQLLIDRMMKRSQRLRNLAAEGADFSRQDAVILVRAHLVGVQGFDPPVPIERDRQTKALSEAAVLALREAIDDRSWVELVSFIDRLYKVDGGEEKNSVSPLGKLSRPSGLPAPRDGSASSDGNSTSTSTPIIPGNVSSSIPAPAAGSERTIDRLFGSTSDSSMAPAETPPSSSQTDDR